MTNKRGEGYVQTCIMILIFCIGIAVFMSFVTAVNIVRISKRNTYKVIDGYVISGAIESFNSIKMGSKYIETLDSDEFEEYFCEYNGMEKEGNTLVSKTDTGYEKYRVKDLKLSFIQDQSLKLNVEYTLIVPISFGDFTVMSAAVPVSINANYTDKFS